MEVPPPRGVRAGGARAQQARAASMEAVHLTWDGSWLHGETFCVSFCIGTCNGKGVSTNSDGDIDCILNALSRPLFVVGGPFQMNLYSSTQMWQ